MLRFTLMRKALLYLSIFFFASIIALKIPTNIFKYLLLDIK